MENAIIGDRLALQTTTAPIIQTRTQISEAVIKRKKRVLELADKFILAIVKSADYKTIVDQMLNDDGLSKDLTRRVISSIKKRTGIRPPTELTRQFKTINENYMSQIQFDKLIEYAITSLQTNTDPTFCYYSAVFLMCAFTGKRLNEILAMTKKQLEMFRDKRQLAIYIEKTGHVGQVKWLGPAELLSPVVNLLISGKSTSFYPYNQFTKHWKNVFGTLPPRGIKFHSLRYKNVGKILLSHGELDTRKSVTQ